MTTVVAAWVVWISELSTAASRPRINSPRSSDLAVAQLGGNQKSAPQRCGAFFGVIHRFAADQLASFERPRGRSTRRKSKECPQRYRVLLWFDGVYQENVKQPQRKPRLHRARAPTSAQLTELAGKIANRVCRQGGRLPITLVMSGATCCYYGTTQEMHDKIYARNYQGLTSRLMEYPDSHAGMFEPSFNDAMRTLFP
jgi:hypothetical protein